MAEFEVKKTNAIADGKHQGRIIRIYHRHTPYKYTDMVIKPQNSSFELRYGVPTNLTPASKLGKLLRKFISLEIGQKIDIEKVLVGKEVEFQTVTETTERGRFMRIVDGSIMPIQNQNAEETI